MSALQGYCSSFRSGVSVQNLSGLVGRIIRGKKPEDFESMTDDPERKLVMIMGCDGLSLLPGKSGHDMLVAIGYEPDYLKGKVREGNQFKLVVFPESGGPAKLATWDNVVEVVSVVYPDIRNDLYRALPQLKSRQFLYWNSLATTLGGYPYPPTGATSSFLVVEQSKDKKNHPLFITHERFLRTDRSAFWVRAFLYYAVHLRELFSGDGYTYDDKGQRGMQEYIVPNCRLSDLPEYELMDLTVQLPQTSIKGANVTTSTRSLKLLDFPPHYDHNQSRNSKYVADPSKLLFSAAEWRKKHDLKPVGSDKKKIYVLDIDDQGDFVFPDGALFVAGRSGTGAMDALRRRVEFVYRYLAYISDIVNTLDSHLLYQVFYGSAHLNKDGAHPAPHTIISADEYRQNYRPNPAMAAQLKVDVVWLQKQFQYYCEQLEKSGKYALYIWPYHCMLGSPGHRLAGLMEEARMFHAFARGAKNDPEIKGGNPLIEHYSIFAPEVTTTWDGRTIPGAQKNVKLIQRLISGQLLFIIGEAASHCVKTSIDDLLTEILATDPALAKKVVVLRDCSASVVIPGIVDFTDQADAAYQRFQDAGMNVLDSTDHARIEELILAA